MCAGIIHVLRALLSIQIAKGAFPLRIACLYQHRGNELLQQNLNQLICSSRIESLLFCKYDLFLNQSSYRA